MITIKDKMINLLSDSFHQLYPVLRQRAISNPLLFPEMSNSVCIPNINFHKKDMFPILHILELFIPLGTWLLYEEEIIEKKWVYINFSYLDYFQVLFGLTDEEITSLFLYIVDRNIRSGILNSNRLCNVIQNAQQDRGRNSKINQVRNCFEQFCSLIGKFISREKR